jgi:PAS domain S-box-containing protein
MLATILTKMQNLNKGQWLVLIGIAVSVLSSSGDISGISILDEHIDRIYCLGLIVVLTGLVYIFTTSNPTQTTNCPSVLQVVRECEERQKAILDHHPRSFYETNDSGDICFVNKAYVSLAGRAVSEIEGSNWAITVHPDDRQRVMGEWRNAIKHHRRFETEYTLLGNDGSEFLVRNVASPMGKPPFGWVGIVEELEVYEYSD